jgi:hypothetical protein
MDIERATEIYLHEIRRLVNLEPTGAVKLQLRHVQGVYRRRVAAEARGWINVDGVRLPLPWPTEPEIPRDERYRDWHERTAAELAETLGGKPDYD